MKNKIILFVCALPAELKSVKEEVRQLSFSGVSVKFFLSGVGNYKAIYNLKNYLDHLSERPDFIVNVGLCGKTISGSDDLFQVYRILGAANGRERIPPIYVDHLPKKSLLSSEKIITREADMQGEQYVDMESYAIDIVCSEEKIPYIILKKPFDTVSEESKKIDKKKFERCLCDFAYEKLLQDVSSTLEKHHDEDELIRERELKNTLEFFRFTFSEKEIWKKGYAKTIAFGENYKEFLRNNKDLNKSAFLDKLTHG